MLFVLAICRYKLVFLSLVHKVFWFADAHAMVRE